MGKAPINQRKSIAKEHWIFEAFEVQVDDGTWPWHMHHKREALLKDQKAEHVAVR